jgi:hypothetical protein
LLALAGVLVSIAALIFGIYQWKRQHGSIRLELNESQATIHLRICVGSPIPITVNGIRYELCFKGIMFRQFATELFSKEKDTAYRFSKRLKFAWFIRNFIAMGWCEPISEDSSTFDKRGIKQQIISAPILGPSFPTKIDGYHDLSWAFNVPQYHSLFKTIYRFGTDKIRLRFVASISGHPQRLIKSRWLEVMRMESLFQCNAWLFKDVENWPHIQSKQIKFVTNQK